MADVGGVQPAGGGFLLIFIFWALYGLRFKRLALWITNGIAVVMQTALLVAINVK